MNTITQQEIKNLPAPPQEWVDEMYPKYDMLPHEIWNKIYDIKYELDKVQHNQNKCDFWEHDEKVGMPTKKVRASLRLMTAKEYQAKSNRYPCPVNEWKLIRLLRNLDDREQFAKVCKKLETQTRPRKATFIEFDRFMNIIQAQEYMDIEKIFEYNRIYLEDTTVETNYKNEVDAHWKKYHELEQVCWDENDKERKIDRLVSC
tara:strand:+ start:58 stop:666 length:609 start_codon:yes stop_codon:yes gene_type:complete